MRSSLLLSGVLAAALATGTACADAKKPVPAEEKPATVAAKVKDPVCGMTVDPKTADKSTYNGKTYYFCSRDEKVEFDKNPAKYAKR